VIVIVMGVSGVGKTTIGQALAERLGWRFMEGDDYHPADNVAKMASGTPLEDADRWPWLDRLNLLLRELQVKNEPAVLTCSALKESYRRRLTKGLAPFQLVHLHGSYELIRARVGQRKHRYMPASLLESQYATLEPPAHAIAVDVAAEAPSSVAAIAAQLGR
jgi:carbohydrate kinase (thermoresistant glucokinase family)